MRYGRGSRRGKAKTKKKRRRGKNLKGGRVPRRTILVTVSEVILSAVFSIRTSGNKRNKSTRFKQSIRIKKNLKFSQTKPITVSVLVLAWFFHIRHFAQFGPVCIFVVVPACYLAAHFCRLVKCIRLHLKCGMWNDKAYNIFRYQCCTIILDMINERIHWLTQHALPVRHHRDSNVFFFGFCQFNFLYAHGNGNVTSTFQYNLSWRGSRAKSDPKGSAGEKGKKEFRKEKPAQINRIWYMYPYSAHRPQRSYVIKPLNIH